MRTITKSLAVAVLGGAALVVPLTGGAAQAATTGQGTYSSYSTNAAGQTWTHAGDAAYTCDADGTITVTLTGSEEAGVGDGHSTQGTIVGNVLSVTALRTGDGYAYSYAGTIDRATGDWTMTTYNDEALQQGVTGGGHLTGLPDCTAPADPTPVTVKGTHGEYVSGATKAGVKGTALAKIAKDVTLVGPYRG